MIKEDTVKVVVAIKGFDKGLSCRGFQFEVGKTFKHEGKVEVCSSGFHAIEGHPLEVLNYYAPGLSVFHEVELSGPLSRSSEDSKIASAEITIKAELKIPELVSRSVKWVMDRATYDQGAATATDYQGVATATGYRGVASATGYQGVATATGDQGAASATGSRGVATATGNQGAASATDYRGVAFATDYRGVASAAGYRGVATATGNQGAASAAGDRGVASATGDQGVASAAGYRGVAFAAGNQGAASAVGYQGAAVASGRAGRASGADGNAIFLAERNDDYEIIAVWAGIVGKDGIEPDMFYTLKDGKPVLASYQQRVSDTLK
ncbi:hypothetical protein AX761_24325 [Rhizobium sp. 58]|nr:hypothetical protein AX761_24325 [Rhizobium sp. 58]